MNKLFLLLVSLILVMGLASAEQQLGTFKSGECINLRTTCANCTFVNITSIISEKNTSNLITQSTMTKSGTEYNYTFCNTKYLGKYTYTTYGNPDGTLKVQPVTFNVTSTGNDKNLYLPLILGIFAILLLVSGIFVRNSLLGLFSSFCFIILGIYSMIYGMGIIRDEYTQMISYVIIGLGTVIGFASVYELYEESRED